MSKKWKKSKAHHDDVLHQEEFQQAAAVAMAKADDEVDVPKVGDRVLNRATGASGRIREVYPDFVRVRFDDGEEDDVAQDDLNGMGRGYWQQMKSIDKAEWTDYAKWAGRVAGLVALATGNPVPLILSLAGDYLQELYDQHLSPDAAAVKVEGKVKAMNKVSNQQAYKEGYSAQKAGKDRIKDNPYNAGGGDDAVWWQKGWLDAKAGETPIYKTGSPWYVDTDSDGRYVVTDESGNQTRGPYATYSEAERAATEWHRKRQKSTDEYAEIVADRLGIDGDVELEADKLKAITKGGPNFQQWWDGEINSSRKADIFREAGVLRDEAASQYASSNPRWNTIGSSAQQKIQQYLRHGPYGPSGMTWEQAGWGESKAIHKEMIGGAQVWERSPGQWVVHDVRAGKDRGTYPSYDQAMNAAASMGYKSLTKGTRVKFLRPDNPNLFSRTIQKNEQRVVVLDGKPALARVTKVQGTDAWVEVKKKSHFVPLGAILKSVEEPGVVKEVNDMTGEVTLGLDDGTEATLPADSDLVVPEEVEGELLGPFDDVESAEEFAVDLNAVTTEY